MRFFDWLVGAPKAPRDDMLKCRACGHEQHVGEWEDELDSDARTGGDDDLMTFDSEAHCLRCGGSDLIALGKAASVDPAWIDSKSHENRRAHP